MAAERNPSDHGRAMFSGPRVDVSAFHPAAGLPAPSGQERRYIRASVANVVSHGLGVRNLQQAQFNTR